MLREGNFFLPVTVDFPITYQGSLTYIKGPLMYSEKKKITKLSSGPKKRKSYMISYLVTNLARATPTPPQEGT